MAERKQLNKRLLFIVTEDWTFLSHRFHLAIAAIEKGYHVGLLSKFTHHRDIIKNAGVQVFDWSMNRGSINPLLEIHSVIEVVSAISEGAYITASIAFIFITIEIIFMNLISLIFGAETVCKKNI